MNRCKGRAGVWVVLAVAVLLTGGVGPAEAEFLLPVIADTVRDQDNDGIGDLIPPFPGFPVFRRLPAGPLTPGLTEVGILEYDLSAFQGFTLTQATFSGLVAVNNPLPTGPRTVEILLFRGDGVLQPSDFQIPAVGLLTVTYQPEAGIPGVPFAIDVLAEVQSLLDAGATHVGFRFAPLNDQAPGTATGQTPGLGPTLTLAGVSAIPEPGSLTLLGLGAASLLGRAWRRRKRPA